MNKVLVANRGEIALRIMRSLKEMNIKTVAVYSEADRLAPFVNYADEAFLLGPPPSNQSYLLMDKIIEICTENHVDAVHPGYGFLSENAQFAKKVSDAGVIFIGPKPEAIEIMGSKLASKQTVKKYGIPLVPGTDEAISDVQLAKKVAIDVGFPLLVKASAGGGGKGMRIVHNENEFESQLKLAQNEARSAFGDDAVFIEKYVTSPRHIEFQILADAHGNVVHLFERECSIQRRHQKVIEEAPSSVLTPELRKKMGEDACNVAKSCNYLGAGTVEFILDDNLNYYFLEMNTRLQVEHPVTEYITGLDLVKEQIKIARGEKLSFKQDDLSINGHSLEIRVYAEDPLNNFLPDIGKLNTYKRPQGIGVRVDDGFEQGMDIPIYYDPMISKLITHGKNRREAIERMNRAIDEYTITGIQTTLDFCKYAINHSAFVSGKFDTHFVNKHFEPSALKNKLTVAEEKAASVIAAFFLNDKFEAASEPKSSQKILNDFTNWQKNRL